MTVLSYIVVGVNTLTCLMLTVIVMRYQPLVRLGVVKRAAVGVLILGLMLQAAEHYNIILDHQAHRAYSWVVNQIAIYTFVWSVFVRSARDLLRH